MREANGWNLLNLATLAACYASGAARSAVAATRTDEELFTKLAAAANLSSEKLSLGSCRLAGGWDLVSQ